MARAEEAPKVITLTQTGCRFVESKGGIDRGYKDRPDEAKPVVLAPGKYIFRVADKNVPYGPGFWLRGTGLGRVTLPSVSGGGLDPGCWITPSSSSPANTPILARSIRRRTIRSWSRGGAGKVHVAWKRWIMRRRNKAQSSS